MTDPVAGRRLAAALPGWDVGAHPPSTPVVGVIAGEGIGPEVVGSALHVLEAMGVAFDQPFDIRYGPTPPSTQVLTEDVISFCKSILTEQGAVMCGAVGGRFVYELRAHFDLFCKFTPLRPLAGLSGSGVLQPEAVRDVDILMVRENIGGLYFGDESSESDSRGLRVVRHRFQYRRDEVERILNVALDLARRRRGRLALVVKPGGMQQVSALWSEVLERLARGSGVATSVLAIDYASYHLIARARELDVVVSPNMVGDVLADCGGLLLGSRGMTFSGNFGPAGAAVYQTGHGAAYDLAGSDEANPLGQIGALALMLRESFGLAAHADAVEGAVDRALADGWRTGDIATPGTRVVGTRLLAEKVADAVVAPAGSAPA